MFLSLRKLSELGDQGSKLELPRVGDALKAREAMLIALGDHDHEAALVSADQLIGLIPGHKDAVRTIRESGQIFWLLGQAQKSLRGVSDPVKTDEVQPALMPQELNEEQKKAWRVQTVRTSLHVLGKTFTETGGVLSEETKKAIKGVIPSYDDRDSKLTDEVVIKISKKAAERFVARIEQKNEETRFAAISNARQFISKARSLDPQFKDSVQLEELLDKAHSAMVLSGAWRIYLRGSLAVIMAAQVHGEAVKGFRRQRRRDMARSRSFGPKIAPIMRETREDILGDILTAVNASAKNLASYKAGAALALAEEAQRFALTCSRGVERLIEPTGSVLDFRRAGVETLDEFKAMDLKFKETLPPKSTSDEFAKSAKSVLGFNLFRKPETKGIIERNEKFYDL
jgi:hypothetical protein